ncbi:MAG: hypothetical protein ACE5J2_05355 [Nitrososphaerales archaeon]
MIEHYNNIINKAKDADYVFEIVGDILSEDVKEEQDVEDILTKREI